MMSVFEAALAEAEGLLVSSNVIVDREVIALAPQLRVISTMSVGLDHIDLDAARVKKIVVTITPVLSDAVADLTMALMIMLSRRICRGNSCRRRGSVARDLVRRRPSRKECCSSWDSVALVRRWRRGPWPRGCDVQYVDPRNGLPVVGGVDRAADLAQGLAGADFVSLHVDLNAETRKLMGRDEFKLMKSTGFLVNTSRGGVVDQAALTSALAEGDDRWRRLGRASG